MADLSHRKSEAKIQLKGQDGKPLSSAKKMILTPGEMVVQPMNEKMLADCRDAKEITVAITAEKAV